MSIATLTDYQEVIAAVTHYGEGSLKGDNEVIKKAFHKDATMYGNSKNFGFLGGSVDTLYKLIDEHGPVSGLKSRFDVLDITGTMAVVKVTSDDWWGGSYTDILSLLKVEGEWKVISKLFHQHS